MAVRSFDGINDRIQLSVGACAALGSGACSIIFLVKLQAQDGAPFWAGPTGGGASDTNLLITPFGFSWFATTNGNDYPSFASAAAGVNWTLVGFSKAAGSDVARGHRYVYDTVSMVHGDASGTLPNTTFTADTIFFGFNRPAGQYGTMLLGAVAVYDVELSDGDFEGLIDGLADWMALNPIGAWALNQASVATPVEDLTAGGADETAIVGTTVVTGDDPPGFDFALSVDGVLAASAPAAVAALTGTATNGGLLAGIAPAAVAALAGTATPAASGTPGGWYTYLSVLAEARALALADRNTPPAACPNDGEPLRDAGRGVLFCPYDGWQYPRDWVRV